MANMAAHNADGDDHSSARMLLLRLLGTCFIEPKGRDARLSCLALSVSPSAAEW